MYSGPTLHYLNAMEREAHVRKTFRSFDEVVGRWLSETQSEGKYRSVYFHGPVIYDYGEHFPMARIVRNRDGAEAILLNNDSYSVSTSRHQSFVRRAVSRRRTFDVCTSVLKAWTDNPDIVSAHITALKVMAVDAENSLSAAKAARRRKIEHFWAAREHIARARRYAEFFGLSSRANAFAASLTGDPDYVEIMKTLDRLDDITPSIEFLSEKAQRQVDSEVGVEQLQLGGV